MLRLIRKKNKCYALSSLDFSCEHQYFFVLWLIYVKKKLSLDNDDL